MSTPDSIRDDVLAPLGALTTHDVGAEGAASVRRRAHRILARRRRRARSVPPALVAFARFSEPVFAGNLGACSFLWIVARCLQIYGLLPG
ncbi:MAG: hypothetical protein ACOY3Y_01755 [Acidobacteriota bacterium]